MMSYQESVSRIVGNLGLRLRNVQPNRRLEGLLAVLAGLILWELYARGQPDFFFPGLERIFLTLLSEFQGGTLLTAFANSMSTLALGFTLAVIVGIPIGLAMGMYDRVGSLLNPYVNGLYVAPISAMVPLIILLGGATFESRVAVVMLFAVFEIIVDTYEGTRTVPNRLLDVVKSFGANSWFTFRHVVIPHDLPYIFTGIRLGLGRGLKGMILAELLIEFANLGAIIRLYQTRFDTSGVIAIVLLLMVLGVVFVFALQRVEYRMMPWHKGVDL